MSKAKQFLSEIEQAEIKKAVEAAEKNTSGEIRLFIESKCKIEVLDRASFVFNKLDMQQTKLRNGVLFYLAFQDKKFAILGDAGINKEVPEDFWNEIKETVLAHFAKGEYATGLKIGIEKAGQSLKQYFPYQSDDVNELSDDIAFGD